MKSIIIPKGWHFSLWLPKFFISTEIKETRDIKFDDTCRYEIDEPSCVNKLFGWTHGLFGVHKESDRFGWVYNAPMNDITIFAYVYTNGKLHKKPIGSVEIGAVNTFTLETLKVNRSDSTTFYGDEYVRKVNFYINGTLMYTYTANEVVGCGKFHVGLTPYFGGNSRAPHMIRILSD